MNKEKVKLTGGLNDGEVIEVYEGMQFVEVPFREIKDGKLVDIVVEAYERTNVTAKLDSLVFSVFTKT